MNPPKCISYETRISLRWMGTHRMPLPRLVSASTHRHVFIQMQCSSSMGPMRYLQLRMVRNYAISMTPSPCHLRSCSTPPCLRRGGDDPPFPPLFSAISSPRAPQQARRAHPQPGAARASQARPLHLKLLTRHTECQWLDRQ